MKEAFNDIYITVNTFIKIARKKTMITHTLVRIVGGFETIVIVS